MLPIVYFCNAQMKTNMNKKVVASGLLLVAEPVHTHVNVSNGPISYLIGGIIALLIMGYLVYTLIRPEKF